MTTYFERLPDGTVGRNTCMAEYAKRLGLELTTDRGIVYGYDGRRYVAGEEPVRPMSVADYDFAMEDFLRSEQIARGYTTRSPSEYASSTNERWAQDARDWSAHLTDVMEYALRIENDVAAGRISPPTLAEFLNGIPKITWTMEV
ncbi:MAG: hypothetical protein MJZ81_07570 [Bacteroidales bacterium]|nr:hypothetical protein [Bacteroidales bacterium]